MVYAVSERAIAAGIAPKINLERAFVDSLVQGVEDLGHGDKVVALEEQAVEFVVLPDQTRVRAHREPSAELLDNVVDFSKIVEHIATGPRVPGQVVHREGHERNDRVQPRKHERGAHLNGLIIADGPVPDLTGEHRADEIIARGAAPRLYVGQQISGEFSHGLILSHRAIGTDDLFHPGSQHIAVCNGEIRQLEKDGER